MLTPSAPLQVVEDPGAELRQEWFCNTCNGWTADQGHFGTYQEEEETSAKKNGEVKLSCAGVEVRGGALDQGGGPFTMVMQIALGGMCLTLPYLMFRSAGSCPPGSRCHLPSPATECHVLVAGSSCRPYA